MRSDQAYLETPHTHKHLICWKSTLAGLALAIVVFLGFLALSVAFGGIGLSDGSSAKAAGTFVAGSLIIATIFAAFSGGYLASRLGRTEVDALGTTQGMVVGAVFLIFVMCQVNSVVGAIGKAAGHAMGAATIAVGGAATAASENPMVQDIVQDNFGELRLKSDPAVVAKGVASRLLRGDDESAKNYLAYQAGVPASEVDQKINAAKAKIDEATTKLREATASAMKATGWSLFVILVLGMISSGVGGLLATKCNEKYTLDTHDDLKKDYKRTRT
ncbi:MAG: hypothetical protein V4596_03625 [Bdellovibrionota bacterium]